MKVKVNFLTVVFFAVSLICIAQKQSKKHSYIFPSGQATVKDILNVVRTQPDTAFSWDTELLQLDVVVLVPPGNTINDVIAPVLDSMGFKLVRTSKNRCIAIVPKINSTAAVQSSTAVRKYKISFVDSNNTPLPGTTIISPQFRKARIADSAGIVIIESSKNPLHIIATYVGMQPVHTTISDKGMVTIIMRPMSTVLDEVIKGYNTGTLRTNTDDRTILHKKQLTNMPGNTVLNMIAGQAAGINVTQSSGIPSASTHMAIHGTSSLVNGSEALYLINNVPFAPQNQSVSNIQSGNSAGSLNPFRALGINNVERIEILKDADATAIYGSRGANGVVLISSAQAKTGKPVFGLQTGLGYTSTAQNIKLMNTPQYLQMRWDGIKMDQQLNVPTDNASDLRLLDTTKYTNWRRWLIGNPAFSFNIQGTMTGGTERANYYAGVSEVRENSVFVTQPTHNNFDAYINGNLQSKKKKLSLNTYGMFSKDDDNQFLGIDPTSAIFLAPIAPGPGKLLDAQDRPIAAYGNPSDSIPFLNPWTSLRQTYHSRLYNVLFDGVTTFRVLPTLTLSNNLGWNSLTSNEYGQFPISAQASSPTNSGASFFSHTRYTSFILEPQAEFKNNFGLLHVALLAGYSFQNQTAGMNSLSAFGFATDAQLMHPSSATSLSRAKDSMNYNYQAQFARFNFNWDDRYILNLTFRRDASSRINSISRYEGFYAAGAAWVFSYERWIKENLPILSFGKLRGSYGTTGNDQIGGGHTLSNWAPNALINYVNKPGWAMRSLVAPGLNWEKIAKAEGSLELGFLNDRFLLSAVWYRNHSSNQILPDKNNIWRNFPVVLENKGWDLTLSAQLIRRKNISWSLSCNLSLPTERLVAFPNLDQSSYKDMLIVGQSVNASRMYKYLGVDAATGRLMFFDKNRDGIYDSADLCVIGGPVVKASGGFSSSIRYGNIQLDMLFDIRIETGYNYLSPVYNSNQPGNNTFELYSNAPASVANRWEKPGDLSSLPGVSTNPFSPIGMSINTFLGSNGMLVNASFVRMKKLSLSYQLPLRLVKTGSASIFVNGQNLVTLTGYKGIVETENLRILPPMRIIEMGLHLNI